MMGEIKDEMVTKVMMEVKVQMTSSKKLGNHNGRCSVVSEGNKSTGKMNEWAIVLAKDSFMKAHSPEGAGLQLRLDVISTAR